MPLTKEQRQEIVTDLTTNCDCWKADGAAEVLANLTDEQLVAQGRTHSLAKMATTGFKDPDGNSFRLNAATGKWEGKKVEKKGKGGKPTANAPRYGPDDEEEEETEESEEMDKENKRRLFGKKKATENALRRPRTAEEWYDAAPPDVQAKFDAARAWEDGERNKLANRLAANVAEDERPQRLDWLRTQTLEVLQNMASMLPAAAPARKAAGKGMALTSLQLNAAEEEDEEVLPLPTLSWGDEADQDTRNESKPTRSSGREAEVSYSDEETLANLPSSVRNEILESRKLIQRERDSLIEQVTANMDEDEAEAFARKWASRPIGDLRDIARLAPKRSQSSVYFGGAGVPLGNRGLNGGGGGLFAPAGGDDDEVLPLPTMNFDRDDEEDDSVSRKGQKRKHA